MDSAKYIGMDVHKESISIAVMNRSGKIGALLGNCGTFSVFTPQSGQRTRYSSITTVVRNSKQGRSRTSRS